MAIESLHYKGKQAIRPHWVLLSDCREIFPHQVELGTIPFAKFLAYDTEMWCEKYCQGHYMVVDTRTTELRRTYLFDDNRDAVMFKLKFYKNGQRIRLL
jgi:hypothetical protein